MPRQLRGYDGILLPAPTRAGVALVDEGCNDITIGWWLALFPRHSVYLFHGFLSILGSAIARTLVGYGISPPVRVAAIWLRW